jgi:hypothetical protein
VHDGELLRLRSEAVTVFQAQLMGLICRVCSWLQRRMGAGFAFRSALLWAANIIAVTVHNPIT